MLFNSVQFLLFFAVVYGLYAALGRRAQNRLLLVASYFFYGCWNPKLLSLIAISTAVDYLCGRRIEDSRDPAARKRYVALSVATNLGILGCFKYFDFFTTSLSAMLHGLGIPVEPLRLELILPVGISFYTFQTMSYSLDVYRRQVRAERNVLDFALYVAFFPQLVAGPIERGARFLPQIRGERSITWESWRTGAWLILLGFFQKVVIADNLAPVADAVFSKPGEFGALVTLTGIYAFAFQIYGDFAGYSNIARGLAALMGFELMANFRMPYFALDPSDFWRRWHISLSSWLRDYLMATMLLGGLWHGASWNFVAWGGFHGLLLIAYGFVNPLIARVNPRGAIGETLWTGLRMFVFFHLVCFGWVLFRVAYLRDASALLGGLFGSGPAIAPSADLLVVWAFAAATLVPLLALEIAQERHGDLLVIKRWAPGTRLVVYMTLFALIVFTGATTGDEFIYFQF
jgi:D-alanyl-lipoteichoic acid acyltransferase DltB (MBOAT superfamily)